MVRCTVERQIAAPPEQVFELFADLRHAAERIAGIKRLEVLTEGPIGVGTRFRETREFYGREATEELTITAFDPARSYTVNCVSGGSVYTSTFRFRPNGAGTIATVEFEARPVTLLARLMSPLGWLMAGAVRKCVEGDLDELKRCAEQGSPGP
jgi:carbon monoxide dehydrogenase subunit G